MIWQKNQLLIREVVVNDVPILTKWLSDERILIFYKGRDQPYDKEKVQNEFLTFTKGMIRCMVEWEGKAIGYLQFYQVDEDSLRKYGYRPQDRVWGMDQVIGEPDYWNRGIGTVLVQAAVRYLVAEKGARFVIMDPQVRNTRAIRCYEKCGLKKVQMLPRHKKHEGVWQHCWLMELESESLS
ncbi:GNAT family N-acetyltransferase [Desmospora activa]|uniref:Aminoglycoside 6'-N-acetyltransferase n=1 Tax=Desmospora activa DSM 45169 TaxID=1121389 RepID=A0A2T4ZB85_9BACL|nr:GNAT family N-acetyltransferase [Desmospora activa]PTM59158.1 aminoglycoside 6'-N-acetyltransferase [Desmospora activa DSM 45169]